MFRGVCKLFYPVYTVEPKKKEKKTRSILTFHLRRVKKGTEKEQRSGKGTDLFFILTVITKKEDLRYNSLTDQEAFVKKEKRKLAAMISASKYKK